MNRNPSFVGSAGFCTVELGFCVIDGTAVPPFELNRTVNWIVVGVVAVVCCVVLCVVILGVVLVVVLSVVLGAVLSVVLGAVLSVVLGAVLSVVLGAVLSVVLGAVLGVVPCVVPLQETKKNNDTRTDKTKNTFFINLPPMEVV
jgi:O-antigen ligase